MSLTPGSRLGPYEVVAPLGAGGMGEVYRARDTKLGREVAVKILPAALVHDAERVARFRREAQILAALNHPHIAAIHGLEEADATQFLVLELVEGETLAERLAGGALPVSEALAIARQVADALEAAHEKGIIHRDLKPANIALTADGQVKVLDFGLAKALDPTDPAAGQGGLTHSPTLTFAATQAGVILGTAAYMSPEQAKGRAADKRSDVWAFGCVLYEMLTGQRAFQGEDATDTIAAIVRGEPDWNALPADVAEQIRLLIKRCLEKDRRSRVSDIGVARFLMTETIAPPHAGSKASRLPADADDGSLAAGLATQAASRRRVLAAAASGLLAGAALTALLAWALMRSTTPAPALPARFALLPAASQMLVLQGSDRGIDISPDGTYIVYRGGNPVQSQLFVRALNNLESRPLIGPTLDLRYPFISPDGRWVAFFAGQDLKKVPATGGGAPISLCRLAGVPRGGTWGPDDTIVFSAGPGTGLQSVPAGGGDPKSLTRLDAAQGENGHYFPSFLPNGRALLFTVSSPRGPDDARVAVLDLSTGDRKTIIRGAGNAQYVDGQLIFAAAGALRAVRFDPRRLAVLSDPIPVLDEVMMTNVGAANFAVSRGGSLVYVPARAATVTAASRSLVWVDRQGREEPIKAPLRSYGELRLSPDGARVAVGSRDQQSDIWIWDLARQTLTRLTFDPPVDQAPVWTPDSRAIIWTSQAGSGIPNLRRQSADGTGAVEQLTTSQTPLFPTSISPDGKRVVLWENSTRTLQDIAMLDLSSSSTGSGAAERRPQPLLHTAAVEVDAEVSPDGRWLAYQSNESGRAEVYVRPFPAVDSGRWQVSTSGGTRPAWARNGRELFYLDADGLLTGVPVQTTASTFGAGNPTTILKTKYYPGFTFFGLDLRGYDVSPDGRRFLMIKDAPIEPSSISTPPSMIVVLNWIEELKQRVSN